MQVHCWTILDRSRLLPLQFCVDRVVRIGILCLQSGLCLEREQLSEDLRLTPRQHCIACSTFWERHLLHAILTIRLKVAVSKGWWFSYLLWPDIWGHAHREWVLHTEGLSPSCGLSLYWGSLSLFLSSSSMADTPTGETRGPFESQLAV